MTNSDLHHSKLLADLQNEYHLFYYRQKSMTFAFTKSGNLLEWIIIGKLPKLPKIASVYAINATHDVTHFDTTTGTLHFDALALSSFIAWAFRQKAQWKSFFDFRCYFEKFFNIHGDIDLHMIKIAVATAFNLPVLSEYRYHADISVAQHPQEYAALHAGNGGVIGEIKLL